MSIQEFKLSQHNFTEGLAMLNAYLAGREV